MQTIDAPSEFFMHRFRAGIVFPQPAIEHDADHKTEHQQVQPYRRCRVLPPRMLLLLGLVGVRWRLAAEAWRLDMLFWLWQGQLDGELQV